jgi:hypothetical protein
MTNNFNTNSDNNCEWLTPPEMIKALGEFDLDPCSPCARPWDTARDHYTAIDDGLSKPWYGRVWLNPPYGRKTFVWVKRLADHGDGIALIFARTETKGFHSQVWARADGILFMKDRINFHKVTGERSDRANAPSCMVAYGDRNCEAIKKYADDNGGKYIRLNDE